MNKKIIFLLAILSINACARFKVEKLNSNELFSIPIDKKAEHLDFPEQKGLYYEIPGRLAVLDDWLIVSESSNKQIKIFKNNKLKTIIVSEDAKKNVPVDDKSVKKEIVQRMYSKHLNIPGALAAGKDDDFYVINYISTEDAAKKENKSDGLESEGYYKILHFDVKGNFLQIIGRQGKMDRPFETILWMDTDDDNNLWILYKSIEQLVLDKYKDGILVYSMSQMECEEALFSGQKVEDNSITQCEEMYPFYNDDKILLIGRIDKLPEKKADNDSVYIFQRRIYKTKNIKNKKLNTIFENMNDPEDYPYIPHGSNILIWKTAKLDRFKLAVYDTDGDLVKFLQIDLPGRRNSWRSTYATLAGDFYSLKVQSNNLQVIKWK
ncbi:MAG: hypothetical protein OEV78_02790 [Spirochaetia bacterium]|nr:hypothetical protein [Spirochaetia bacterium]